MILYIRRAQRKHRESKPNTAVLNAHVIVNTLASGERRHTLPANVRLTARARHVVTSFATLDGYLAGRAALDVMVRRPLLEELIFGNVALLARHTIVVLDVACWTDTNEARGTLQD